MIEQTERFLHMNKDTEKRLNIAIEAVRANPAISLEELARKLDTGKFDASFFKALAKTKLTQEGK